MSGCQITSQLFHMKIQHIRKLAVRTLVITLFLVMLSLLISYIMQDSPLSLKDALFWVGSVPIAFVSVSIFAPLSGRRRHKHKPRGHPQTNHLNNEGLRRAVPQQNRFHLESPGFQQGFLSGSSATSCEIVWPPHSSFLLFFHAPPAEQFFPVSRSALPVVPPLQQGVSSWSGVNRLYNLFNILHFTSLGIRLSDHTFFR